MITKTSLSHPSTIEEIKGSILIAVARARSEPSGVYIYPIYNRKGKIYMAVLAVKGEGYRIQNTEYEEVTDMVNEVLREYHASRKNDKK